MTMNVFNFNGQELRSMLIEGEPWFVSADACRVLRLRANPSSGSYTVHLRRLDADERQVKQAWELPATRDGRQVKKQTVVSESGLYKLIMRSDKPEAIAFQNWVTKEVLPSIRKTGGYLLNEEARPVAHADNKEAMPLPEGFAQMFQMLFAPVVKPLQDLIVTQGDKIAAQGAIILSMQAHLEKLASGEEPSDVWLSGDLTREMSDGHIRNAIRWAKTSRVPYDVLTKEQARRIRLKKRKAA